MDAILRPTADDRIKKLETLQILAEKKQKIDRRLSDLSNFNASNEGTQSELKFSANNGYHFTITDPNTIETMLGFVQSKLEELKEKTEKEIVNFSI